jgi:hypothetical protein
MPALAAVQLSEIVLADCPVMSRSVGADGAPEGGGASEPPSLVGLASNPLSRPPPELSELLEPESPGSIDPESCPPMLAPLSPSCGDEFPELAPQPSKPSAARYVVKKRGRCRILT